MTRLRLGCTRAVAPTPQPPFGWYDNEWGYANRLAELAALVGGAA